MHKVVATPPSWSPGRNKHGRRASRPEEQLPKYAGIRRRDKFRSRQVSFLSPLRRWLRAQLGRPWNDVYSEACSVIRPDNFIGVNIRMQLLEMVRRHTFMHGGEISVIVPYSGGGVKPLAKLRQRRSYIYVHPETGTLEELLAERREIRPDPAAERRRQTIRWLNDHMLLRLCHGCWFECRMERFPKHYFKGKGDRPWRFDLAEKKMINRSQARDIYGEIVHCLGKRQLSRRELKRFGLSNSPGAVHFKSEGSGQQIISVIC